MKKLLTICIVSLILLTLSFKSFAGEKAEGSKTKFANVSVVWQDLLKVNIYTTMDGQTTIIVPKYSALDSEKGEAAIFNAVNTELERLTDMGYQLSGTTSVGNTNCIIYTFIKDVK